MILTIKSNAETLSRDGSKTYWLLKTSHGNHSVWDKDLANTLQVGKTYDCEVEENGKYKTIRGNKGEVQPLEVATVSPSNAFTEPSQAKAYEKDPVGLTLDLYKEFIKLDAQTVKELGDDIVQYCIDTVKKVKKAFE